ncbi:ATP-binding protein [Planomonospora corallina]|uniref:histidine kinase n=1 Tax=Planomonospora corallina TaxID=1806052 RepID=A0ABV8IKD3_9ACTN
MVTRTADRVRGARWSQALRAAGLFDVPGSRALERAARLAARLLDASAGLVVLADGDRQVCLGAAGRTARGDADGPAGLREAPEDHVPGSLLRRVEEAGAPLVVCDARPGLRWPGAEPAAPAWAAFPIRAPDGEVLGALCVLDVRPRRWEPHELELVAEAAGAVESQLAARISEGRARLAAARLDTVLEQSHEAFLSIDGSGTVTAWNTAAERLFGRPASEAVGRPADRLIVPQWARRAFGEELRRVRDSRGPAPSGHRVEMTAVDRTGREFPVEMALQADHEYGEPVLHAFLHDIGDRLAARRGLEQERTFLTALLDSLDVVVAACDGEGRLTFNQVLREAIHASEQPVRVEEWAEAYRVHAPDGVTRLRPEEVPLARALAGERFDDQEVVVHTPEGRPRRLLVNGRPIETADGRLLGAVVAGHDITDRHRIERMSAAQRAAAQALAEAGSSEEAACGVVAAVAGALGWTCGEYWQVDPGGGTISRLGLWTRPGRDLSALTRDEPDVFPPGQGLAGMVWASGRETWIPDLAADPRDFTRKGAALRSGLRAAMGLPVRSDRQILGVLTFFTDTVQEAEDDLVDLLDGIRAHVGRHMERRRAEELALALAASRRRLEQIIDQIDDYVWTVELAPDGTVRPVYTSPDGGTAVFGGPLPRGPDGFAIMTGHVHPDDLPAFIAFHDAVASGRPAEAECRIRGMDGVTRWIWMRGIPRREGDRFLIDGISTDVTERHRMAEERDRLLAGERAQVLRLRELDRMKDELISVVSHELRNPIGTIRASVGTFLNDPELTDEQRMFAEVIDRKSAHLQRLLDDLLDLARLDSGGITIDPRPLPLTPLVLQSVDDHRAAAEAKRLTVTTDAAEDPSVHADPVRLRQVLDNLLSNAIKYTPDGGSVAVTVRREEPADGRGPEAVVGVADTGIGIPAEQYSKLFSRFFRASTALQSGVKGTGLGLAITKAIVEAHGGAIAASPREGGGTVFAVRLPEIPRRATGERD